MPQMYAPHTGHIESAIPVRPRLLAPHTDRAERAEPVSVHELGAPGTRTPAGQPVGRERREAIAFFRGALVASAVVAPFWAVVAVTVWLLTR